MCKMLTHARKSHNVSLFLKPPHSASYTSAIGVFAPLEQDTARTCNLHMGTYMQVVSMCKLHVLAASRSNLR